MTHSPGLARRLIAVVGALGIALVSTACGSGATTSNSAAGSGKCDPKATGPGVTDSQVLLGATMPLTGSAAAGGVGDKEGQEAFYDKLNKDGGIQGRQVKVNILDDAYDPSTAQKQMRQLVENDKILAVSGGEGTPNFLGVVPYLKRQGVPAIAPYAPSDTLGTMDVPNVFMATVDYVTEFEILTNYALQQGPTSKMALVGVAGNVGDNARDGMKKAIGDKKIDLTYVPETPGTTDFTPIASQLKQSGAEWVFLILTNADTGGLLQAMSRIGYTPKTAAWAGMSDDSYITEFGALSQDMIVALETAALDSPDPKVQQFVSDFTAQTGHAPTKFNELGWVQAELTAEALKQAKGLSRPCLMDALEGIHGLETGILPPVTWGPDDRTGVDAVGIGQIKGQGLTVLEETRSLDK